MVKNTTLFVLFLVASDSTLPSLPPPPPPLTMLYRTTPFYFYFYLLSFSSVCAGRCSGYISKTEEMEAKIGFLRSEQRGFFRKVTCAVCGCDLCADWNLVHKPRSQFLFKNYNWWLFAFFLDTLCLSKTRSFSVLLPFLHPPPPHPQLPVHSPPPLPHAQVVFLDVILRLFLHAIQSHL